MKYTGPKVRLSRRLGIAMTPKAAKVMELKPYPPGQHGMARQRKMSDYKRQLIEKQRLRAQYNLSEKQLHNYFMKAASKAGNPAQRLIEMLETRLDAVVMRTRMAKTIYAARQYVNHGHVLVNGKRVNVPSYQLREGDVVTIREKSRKIPQLMESWEEAVALPVPPYLEVSEKEHSAKLVAKPQRDDVPVTCEMSLVTEFYSK
jgi:small subunit ribosomal protein S4